MSVVAVKVHEQRATGARGWTIASDSINVRGWTVQSSGLDQRHAKLWRSTHGDVIGCVGPLKNASLLQAFANTHGIPTPNEMGVLSWIEWYNKWLASRTDEKHSDESTFIVCTGTEVFRVEGWGVFHVEDIDAIGAGMDFALAAMHCGKSPKEAVQVAIELSAFCAGPIVEFTTEIPF